MDYNYTSVLADLNLTALTTKYFSHLSAKFNHG